MDDRKGTPLQYTNETADLYIIGAIFLIVQLENTNRNYSTTIDLFATATHRCLCHVLKIKLNHYILVAFLRMSPDVEHRCHQHDDSQRYELGQLISEPIKAIAGNGGIGWNKNEVAGDGSISQRKQRDDPRTNHTSWYIIGTMHVGVFVA